MPKSIFALLIALSLFAGCTFERGPTRPKPGDVDTGQGLGAKPEEDRPGSSSGSTSRRTRPDVRPGQNQIADSALPNLDINRYSFEQKGEFKRVMQDRLESLHKGIAALSIESESATSSNVRDGSRGDTRRFAGARSVKDVAKHLESQEKQLSQRLDGIEQIPKENWEKFKSAFRDDVTTLERDYQSIVSSRR